MAAHTSLGTMPIHLWGTDEQKDDWLPQLCSGQKLAAFGLTEPEAGSDAGNTHTRAALEDGEWVVNGAKQFITNSGTEISGCVTITAVTGQSNGTKEISNIIVPNGTPGLRGRASPTGRWAGTPRTRGRSRFDDCRVPEGNLLGRRGEGFKQFLQILDGGRIGVAAMGVGPRPGRARRGDLLCEGAPRLRAADRASSRRSRRRSPTSRPRSRPRACSSTARRAKDRGEPFTLTAAQAKLITGRLAVRATEEAVQIHGGYGYIEEYPVCRFYRDAKILTIGEGTDEVQQMVIARQLGVLS